MSNTGSRGTRHLFDGTGVYIALFLVVTALAVAGYWTLIPHSAADKSVADDTPVPPVATPIVSASEKDDETTAVMPELKVEEEARPVQSPVTLMIDERAVPDIEPEVPQLVVAPLLGETIAAFSMDELAYSETMGDWRTHDGVDLAAAPGTQVLAASSGTVIDVRDDDLMGTTVVISHDGGYDTTYANLQSIPTVVVGDYVTAGQVIGSVGETALSESALAPHLHFGVTKDGEFIDPVEFLKQTA